MHSVRTITRVAAGVLVALAACGGGGSHDDAPAMARRAPAADTSSAWCAEWNALQAEVRDRGVDLAMLDRWQAAAERGIELGDPAIAGPSRAVVHTLTWQGGPSGEQPRRGEFADGVNALTALCAG